MSKELDNLELIRPMLVFDSDDDFYFLQILQRRKENDGIGANSRVIKNYYIRNVEYLDRRYEEIKALCTVFRARASIRLNRRSFRQVSGRMLVNMANSMSNESFDHGHKLWDKSCGQRAGKYKRTWVLNIDDHDPLSDFTLEVTKVVNYAPPEGKNAIAAVPSMTGTHLITKAFDPRELGKEFPEVSIHKDNPTNLYIPQMVSGSAADLHRFIANEEAVLQAMDSGFFGGIQEKTDE